MVCDRIAAACVIKVVGYYIAEVVSSTEILLHRFLPFPETWYRLVLQQLSVPLNVDQSVN